LTERVTVASDEGVLSSYDLGAVLARLAAVPPAVDSDAPGRRAAVAAVLRGTPGEAEAEILLIRRAEHPRDPWSGHMAFPGGRRDEGDPSLLATAIRETREEVGLDLEAQGELLTRLPDVPAIARGLRVGLTITPFVFALRGEALLGLNDEVAEALWAPLGALGRGEGAGIVPYQREGLTLELPCLHVEGRMVWGLTYQMLQSLFAALRG
jgi:8-oxo-dGTP pyrophosphatase MutT (NUDIX family)